MRRVFQAVKLFRPPIAICDEPGEGAAVAHGTVVSGWAFSPVGIREVAVWLDGRRVGQAKHGLERPDVAQAHPDWPTAVHSGFRYRLDELAGATLSKKTVELTIVAEDGLGRRAEARRVVRPVEQPPLPMAGSLDIPVVRGPNDALRQAAWSSPLVVFGWAIDPLGVERIDVLLDGRVIGQAEHGFPREDVEMLQPEYRRRGLVATSGWLAVIPVEGLPGGQHTLSATVHGRSGELSLGPTPVSLLTESVRLDPVRRERLEATLRCPECGESLRRDGTELVCSVCGHPIRTNEFGTLLLDETYAGLDWRQAVATSHGYPPEAGDIIAGCRDGLVLDIGAGLRENIRNVIQLDAIAFPTTDVAANAEALPFADESFDAVVAANLLEHVSNPLQVMREVRRVCKVGGQIYVDWTSVHPYHGFPHHYLNATETGLDWVAREMGGASGSVNVTEAWITVRLVLEAWLGSLEDADAHDSISEMPVGELVELLRAAHQDPEQVAALDNLFPKGRRLIPPKVTFTGVRER